MTLTKEQIDFMETSGVDIPRVAFLNRLDALCDMARRTVEAEEERAVWKKRANQSIDDYPDGKLLGVTSLSYDGDKYCMVENADCPREQSKSGYLYKSDQWNCYMHGRVKSVFLHPQLPPLPMWSERFKAIKIRGETYRTCLVSQRNNLIVRDGIEINEIDLLVVDFDKPDYKNSTPEDFRTAYALAAAEWRARARRCSRLIKRNPGWKCFKYLTGEFERCETIADQFQALFEWLGR